MMLGKVIFRYIHQALTDRHPVKDFEHCINRHQVKHKCTVCADVCPARVYSGKGVREADFSRCINCGLCVAACPARCIASSSINAASCLKVLSVPERTVFIGTRQWGGTPHLQVEYLAGLSWEYLACVGLRRNVVFLTDNVPEITPGAEAVWQKTLDSLALFFGKEGFRKRFVFSKESVYDDGQEISRRDVFKKANDEIKSRIFAFAPSHSMMDGLLYRYLLRAVLEEGDFGETFGWVIPMISSRCKGCGVCARLCPQEAITVKRETDKVQVFFYPFRCNSCGLCQKTCIHHAVDGFGLTRVNCLKPMLLFDSAMDG